jgi:hypothetical protein
MGFLFDKYSKLKEKTKGMREAVDDVGKIAYDVSKDNKFAKAQRKAMR